MVERYVILLYTMGYTVILVFYARIGFVLDCNNNLY